MVATMATAAVIAGCAPAVARSHYVVDYELKTRVAGAAKQEGELRFPAPSAIEALAETKVVAFAPPDECIEAATGKDMARQRCGEVMSALEQAAADSGLQVVSWQAFRGNEPALNYARHNNVDVLFEINRLGPDDSVSGIRHEGQLKFSHVRADGTLEPAMVGATTQMRCRDRFYRAPNEDVDLDDHGVVLDVKMVSVHSGITLWNYRRLFRSSEKTSKAQRREYYFGSDPDVVMCVDDRVAPQVVLVGERAKTSFLTFSEGTSGRMSSSEGLRLAGQLAASEFVELLAYIQATTPREKRVTLHVPPRPQQARGQVSSVCTTIAAWIRGGAIKEGQIKTMSPEYAQRCKS